MKKGLKKLTLNRETLRVLGTDLRGVAGGVVTQTSCACDLATGCDCETGNCYPETACLGSCSCSILPCR